MLLGTPYSAILTMIVTAGVINIIMGIYVLTNRSNQSMSRMFVAHCFLSAIYIFGSALELSADSLGEVKLWIKAQYLGMPFLPPINLLLVMYFLGMDRFLKSFLRVGLFALPAVTMVLVMSNEAHHLYYRDIVVNTGAAFLKVDLIAGPWYIIAGAYTFGCMIGGVVLLLLYWGRMKASYRIQHITMLTGLVLPLIGDFLYLGNLTPDGIDPIPVIMALTSAMYMWALASRGLMNVAPIARDNLFESMSDGVLVLDMNNRLVDFNPAAAAVMPELTSFAFGRSIEPLWRLHSDGGLMDSADMKETLWRIGEQTYYYDIRFSVVRKKGGQETGKLIVLIDVSEWVRLQQRLHELAFRDGLTGIWNRTHFMQLSEQLLLASAAEQDGEQPFALLLFDIDHFKRINDTHGHDIGDRALIHVVGVCQATLRDEDVFARYGGEEFVIAMPGLPPAGVEAAAERLRQEIASRPMALPSGERLAITASFGIAAASDGIGLKQLLKAADTALYEAKHAGRNTVRTAAAAGTAALVGGRV
ncbi:histidine kinase N-terminal 7TM domain-containing diguanylate cyclase [Paenibacillus silvisoli]|uniref:histidine kinase N-terminal 7TM domain-containing diguanylate cyclase n=1 Tax=Paenibacillus silvisoli TaxID=3110539 RepID=UPI0028053295|nr:histidine kinase N-terminal 7TM domain-containing protein [Paenibacillus silvisoli]